LQPSLAAAAAAAAAAAVSKKQRVGVDSLQRLKQGGTNAIILQS
jgi:hypothetical protein